MLILFYYALIYVIHELPALFKERVLETKLVDEPIPVILRIDI
jgi:hypothetical protein